MLREAQSAVDRGHLTWFKAYMSTYSIQRGSFVLCQRWFRDCTSYMNSHLLICTPTLCGSCSTKILPDMIAFYRPVFPLPSADFTYCFLFAPDGSDDLILSVKHIYFSPGSYLNLSYHVASHRPAEYSCLLSIQSQISCQENFIPNITLMIEDAISPLFRTQPLASVESK